MSAALRDREQVAETDVRGSKRWKLRVWICSVVEVGADWKVRNSRISYVLFVLS